MTKDEIIKKIIKDRHISHVKYINYDNQDIYALYYRKNNTIYYNLNFDGKTQIITYK